MISMGIFLQTTGRSIVKTQPLPGKSRILSSPDMALTAFKQIESPRPRPVRSVPCWTNGRSSVSGSPTARPPHSSSTSMRTRVAALVALRRTVVPGRENLNAFCSRLASAAARILTVCVNPDRPVDVRHGKGNRARPREHGGRGLHLVQDLAHANDFDVLQPGLQAHVGQRALDQRVHALQASIVDRARAAPGPTTPFLMLANEIIAALSTLRSSWARMPSRSVPSRAIADSRSREMRSPRRRWRRRGTG